MVTQRRAKRPLTLAEIANAAIVEALPTVSLFIKALREDARRIEDLFIIVVHPSHPEFASLSNFDITASMSAMVPASPRLRDGSMVIVTERASAVWLEDALSTALASGAVAPLGNESMWCFYVTARDTLVTSAKWGSSPSSVAPSAPRERAN